MDRIKLVLEDALAMIIQYGWIQGRLGSCETGFCADGALRWVCERDEKAWAYVSAYNFLRRATQARSLIPWNDEDDRTQADVEQAFRTAIASLKDA